MNIIERRFLHIHICTGGLGLSLPVPILTYSLTQKYGTSYESLLINRRKSDKLEDKRSRFFISMMQNPHYFLRFPKPKNNSLNNIQKPDDFEDSEIEEITNFRLIESDQEECLTIQDSIKGKNLLITLSPDGNGRNYVVKKLKEILNFADQDSYIFIISCENGYRVSTSFYEKQDELNEIRKQRGITHLYFLDCIVDRLVPSKWLSEGLNKNDNTLYLHTEKYFKWIIEFPIWNNGDNSFGKILRNLIAPRFNKNVIWIDHGEYEKEFYLKTFCINGLHYAIALLQEYSFIKNRDDQDKINMVLFEDNPLNHITNKVIMNLKQASVNMILAYNKKIGKNEDKEYVYTYVNEYMKDFLERLILLEDDRKRILKPLLRLADKSNVIFDKIKKAPEELKRRIGTEIPQDFNNSEKSINNFFSEFESLLKDYENFVNLYEFEDKLMCRLLQPISFLRFHCLDKDLIEIDEPTGNLELERISLIAHYVITDVCFRAMRFTK